MTPSSLIFFVIITVWAVYVVQHWIRRRDHVATARSVDRFSEAMRVLERRRVLPQMNVAAPQRQSYAVGLSRPAHPDVVVKRAQPRLTVVGDAATTAGPTANTGPTPAAPPTRSSAAAPQRRGATSTGRTVTASAPLLTPARTRALALVIGAVLLVAGIALAVTGTWWAAPAGVAAFGAALGYVRFSVARARRRSTSPVRHPSRRPQVTPRPERRRAQAAPAATRRPVRRASGAARLTGAPVAAARVRGSAPIYQAAPVAAQATVTVAAAATVAAAPSRTRDALYDVEAVEASVPAADLDPRQEAPAAQLEPGTWQPVPVPPPTYTLKARAPRARDRAAADTPVEDLPFDGNALALDEEFEDLPAVHHVG